MVFEASRFNSARTLASWHGVAKPGDFLIILLIGSTATVIATVVVNALTSANAPDNDYSSGYAEVDLERC